MGIPQPAYQSPEKELIDGLVNHPNSIEVKLFPICLITDRYDAKILAEEAVRARIPNVVGYFAELARGIAQEIGTTNNIQALDYLTNTLYEKRREGIMGVSPNLPRGYDFQSRIEKMDDLQRKWGVATSIDRGELEKYIDMYVRRRPASNQ